MASLFRRILVPHDFSAPADHALRVAAGLAGAKGRLTVLHVVTPFSPVTGLPPEGLAWIPPPDLVASEQRQLEHRVARALGRRRAPRVRCRVVIGDPFHRIAEAARLADSVVMATAGRTGLTRLVIGSVAEKVVRHSPVPVLTVRPAATRPRSSKRPRRPTPR